MKQRIGVLVFFFLCSSLISQGQAPTAVVNGQVRDTSGAAVPNASVEVVNDATNVRYTTETNDEGIYSVPNVPPGTYHIRVSKQGFKTIVHPDITLNVQDAKAIGFTLPVGPVSDTVTVEGGASLINTQDAAVSTVVDRQFAENLPMNGRSFQTLIQLTPGVVLTPSTPYDSGQFSVNGQRATSNYWMVDGVSANIGVSSGTIAGNGLAGTLGSFSAQGGTNSLVSVDALQEFRIQTSTFAPEFGRTPGAQISILTRSGANQFHGTLFDYLRNDVFDANNWFNGITNPPLPKAKERQNDFGGTFSGHISKDRTFFFFSYEGLRLRLPQTALTTVPDLAARQNAIPAVQPFLNAFPVPNGPDNVATGIAQFNSTYSDSSSLDAYSIRIDHKLNNIVSLFGRYSYSPSKIAPRGAGDSLSTLLPSRITTQTGTVGTNWSISSLVVNDLRFNYSRSSSSSHFVLDNFGGAIPLASLPLPSPFTSTDAEFKFGIFSLTGGFMDDGRLGDNVQRQINVIDNISIQRGSHSIKFGADYRRLSPSFEPQSYLQAVFFLDVASSETGSPFGSFIESGRNGTFLLHNVGAFAQDTWRAFPRLTLTYGLRWEVDVAPSSDPRLNAVTGYDLNNFSSLAIAPAGTPPFGTRYGNFAPRFGVAYQLSQSPDWGAVVRGGFGLFFDLATEELGNLTQSPYFPYGSTRFNCCFNGSFPLDSATAAPPPITPASLAPPSGILFAFDPNLRLPYTLQWNIALEQALGKHQAISVSYIGSVGRRLIQSTNVSNPNPNFGSAILVGNSAASDYNALQLQFHRRLSHGIQTLASYTWSHSIDTASAGSTFNGANTFVATQAQNANRGPSDFDVRQAVSAGLTYEIPTPKTKSFTNAVLRGWSLQNVVQARSAPPVNIYNSKFSSLFGIFAQVRPDVVAGIPLYLFGSQYPGGKIFNSTPGAVAGGCPDGSKSIGPFCPPPTSGGVPQRQGDLGRNALRGFGATQWDLAVHRDFPIRESVKLQFRAEMFNVLNHPNFGQPVGDLNKPQFGQSTEMLGQYLNGGASGVGNAAGGAFSPLYQLGGPRSIQFALKLMF